jgi:hypothetical protein
MKARGLRELGMFVLLVAPAVAGAATYDTSGATITCTTLIGTVSPKPLLSLTEQETVLTLKGKLSGCTVTGAIPADPPLQVVSGTLKAKLPVVGDASCATLIAGFQVTGDFVFKWKTAKDQELDFPTTTFTPDAGGLVASLVPLGATTYGAFTSTGTLATGSAFATGTPTLLLISAEDIYTMFGQCCTDPMICAPVGTGVKKLHIGIGQVQM